MNLLPEPNAPPIYDCGKCARCQAKARKQKLRSIIFGTLWTLWTIGGIGGASMAIYSAIHPEPKTAEEIAQDTKIEKLGEAFDKAQADLDAAVEERDGPAEPLQYDQ